MKRGDAEALPSLVPREPTPGFVLKRRPPLRGSSLVLRLSSKEQFNQARPDWHFLIRWWVKGKPFVGKPVLEQFADQNGRMFAGRNLELQLEFESREFGAQVGDRMGVQLLYVPNGWIFVAAEGSEMLKALRLESAMLSNRADWVIK